MSEAEIDENLKEIFPASDPPAWTLGSDHRPDAEQEPEEIRQSKVDMGSRLSHPTGSLSLQADLYLIWNVSVAHLDS